MMLAINIGSSLRAKTNKINPAIAIPSDFMSTVDFEEVPAIPFNLNFFRVNTKPSASRIEKLNNIVTLGANIWAGCLLRIKESIVSMMVGIYRMVCTKM